jgi:hypothetical protein
MISSYITKKNMDNDENESYISDTQTNSDTDSWLCKGSVVSDYDYDE